LRSTLDEEVTRYVGLQGLKAYPLRFGACDGRLRCKMFQRIFFAK
jgi:hypothetical protein